MNKYESIFEQELHQRLVECQARQARLQTLEGEVRSELAQLEQEEERIQSVLALLSESKKLNACASYFQPTFDAICLEIND